MAFFGASGPGSLTGGGVQDDKTKASLDAIQKAYPQLGPPQQTGQAPQSPMSIAQLGYGGQGPQLYYGQGAAGGNPFSSVNALFERSAGSTADSVTSALSSGQTGPTYSGAQQGVGTAALPPTGSGGISGGLPLAQLSTAGYGMSPGSSGLVPDTGTGGATLNPSQGVDVAGLAQNANQAYQGLQNLIGSGTPSGSSPALTTQRQGEIQSQNQPGSNGLVPGQTQAAGGAGLTTQGYNFSTPEAPGFLGTNPVGGGQGTFSLNGQPPPGDIGTQGFTLGGNPQLDTSGIESNGLPTAQTAGEAGSGFQIPGFGQALGAGAALLGGAGGIQNLIGGIQGGNPIQGAAGGAATLGAINALANQPGGAFANAYPELSGALGLGANALGGLGGAYGLYQGIQQGNPLQAASGAASLYGGAAPLLNATGLTNLPSLTNLASTGLNAGANALGYTGSLTGDISSGVSSLLGGAGGAGAEAGAAGAGAGAGAAGAGVEAGAAGGADLAGLGASLGLTGAGGAALGVGVPLALFSLIGQLTGQNWGNLGDLFNTSGQYAGMSKDRGTEQTLAANLFSNAQQSQQAANTAYAGLNGTQTPDQLRAIGNQLMQAQAGYYQPYEGTGQGGLAGQRDPYVGSGPSTYAFGVGGTPQGNANMAPFQTGMQDWLAINQQLQGMGQSGLYVDPNLVSAAGLGTLSGAAVPSGVDVNNNTVGSPLQNWLNQQLVQYEHGGIQTPTVGPLAGPASMLGPSATSTLAYDPSQYAQNSSA